MSDQGSSQVLTVVSPPETREAPASREEEEAQKRRRIIYAAIKMSNDKEATIDRLIDLVELISTVECNQ